MIAMKKTPYKPALKGRGFAAGCGARPAAREGMS